MADIFERQEMHNQEQVFQNRDDAGELLGRMLAQRYRDASDVVILAIPMGGVPVGLKIKMALCAALDLVIVRKIQIPGNTEAGCGAITQEGDIFINEPLMHRLHLSPDQIERQTREVQHTLEERNRLLRDGRPLPDMSGQTVILVDDGLASGYTMKASIHMVARHNAKKIVVAAPTAPRRTIDALGKNVDEVYCPNIRNQLSFAVAAAYIDWYDLSLDQVKAMTV